MRETFVWQDACIIAFPANAFDAGRRQSHPGGIEALLPKLVQVGILFVVVQE